MIFEAQFNYNDLRDVIQFFLSCFIRIWGLMCEPFIDDYYFSWGGGNYEPTWSYLLPVISIGLGFCCIAFVKTLIRQFLARYD